ncbi:MAG: TIGR04255 family protein [Solirubrobacteraceae bacterium]
MRNKINEPHAPVLVPHDNDNVGCCRAAVGSTILGSCGTLLERFVSTAVFDLAPVGRYRLARPPLVQALGQIRYPVRARLQTLDGVAPLQDRLLDLFPYMNQEQIQQVSLLVGPGMAPAGEAQTARTWRFTDDVGWTLIVAADAATLSIGPQYGDFEEFRSRFATIVAALQETAGLPRCDRLGLRYVDITQMPPGNDRAWREWFRPELVGWGGGSIVAEGTNVVTSITQTQLTAPPIGDLAGPPVDIQAIVRHGYIPANTMVPGILPEQVANAAFLLDVDLFVEGHQPFDAEELPRQLTVLHDQIDRFFRWGLTPAGEAYFGLEEIR